MYDNELFYSFTHVISHMIQCTVTQRRLGHGSFLQNLFFDSFYSLLSKRSLIIRTLASQKQYKEIRKILFFVRKKLLGNSSLISGQKCPKLYPIVDT